MSKLSEVLSVNSLTKMKKKLKKKRKTPGKEKNATSKEKAVFNEFEVLLPGF